MSAMTDTALQAAPVDQGARLLGDGRPPHRARQGQHGLRLHPAADLPVGDLRAVARPRRSLSGLDDPPAAPDRHAELSARHRRTRPRHAGAPDLWRPAVAADRHSAGDPRLHDRHLARPRRRLCRRQAQHRDHAHHRRVLRLSLGAAGDRDLGRARRRHRQLDRLADHRVRAADHPRRRERHHRRAQHGLRRCGARLRRRRRSPSCACTCSATCWGRSSSMRPA